MSYKNLMSLITKVGEGGSYFSVVYDNDIFQVYNCNRIVHEESNLQLDISVHECWVNKGFYSIPLCPADFLTYYTGVSCALLTCLEEYSIGNVRLIRPTKHLEEVITYSLNCRDVKVSRRMMAVDGCRFGNVGQMYAQLKTMTNCNIILDNGTSFHLTTDDQILTPFGYFRLEHNDTQELFDHLLSGRIACNNFISRVGDLK